MKKRFRKGVVLALCLVTAAWSVGGLAACGKEEDDPEAIYLAIQVQGYGSQWLKNLAALYTAKTGVEVVLPGSKEIVFEGGIASEFSRGARNNNTDIFFGIADSYFSYIDTGVRNPSGIGFVDLTDVYESKPEGYGDEYATIRDLIYDYSYDSVLCDGKPYMISWALGMEGIVYHENMLEQYGYHVPRTTDEMIEIARDFTEKTKPASGARKQYAFTWYEGYWLGRAMEWWIQYEGLDAYEAFTHGEDANGNRTPDIYAQIGRLRAFQALGEMLKYSENTSDPGSISEPYTTTQMKFLQNQALFMPNGDWLEREMERNLQEIDATGIERDFKFMRTPIISAITEKFSDPAAWNDTLLRQAISALDGEEGYAMPDCATDSDIAKLKEAMSIVEVQGQRQTAFIPTYSNNIEGAKDFLRFLYSKEAQINMYNTLSGNMFPLKYDISQEDVETTVFLQSKYDLLRRPETVLIGNNFSDRMFFLGGMKYIPDLAIPLSSDPDTSTYRSAEELYNSNYATFRGNWSDILSSAGYTD